MAAVLLAAAMVAHGEPNGAGWNVTGGDAGGMRYSPLSEINRTNVGQLRVAWTYHHGDVRSGWPLGSFRGTAFEATPILFEGLLIFTTPYNRVIALDPETGAERWTFDPKIDRGRIYGNMMINRGVAAWQGGEAREACARGVFLATLDARLIALDAATGRPCSDFGAGGTVNLLEGIEPLVDPWEYNMTSPPTVVDDVVIVGSSIADMVRRIMPPGTVRAFDPRTGKRLWRFDTIPREGEVGIETWENESWRESGGANVWSTITADLDRGFVFLPVSTAGPDFYGGDRPGANLFSDSLVALEARTGRRVWHFQTVHHDLWDYDLAAPPVLVRVERDGREVDAVAQATKTGFVFVLERETGKPLFPVEERPVPKSDVPGESSWPTQPFPVKPPPLVPQRMTEDDLWEADAGRLAKCRAMFRTLRNDGLFTPPSESGSILYPSTGGGVNWSGGAFDPKSGRLYLPANNFAHTIRLKKLAPENFYRTDGLVMQSILGGLRWWLFGTGSGLRYYMIRENFFVDGTPCNKPPWGTLSAIDLNRGEIVWQVPVGETADGVAGTINFGPPLATAGGVVFHGGGLDSRFRAYDAGSGEVLATFDLPAGLNAGPMTYRVKADGPQYLVVAPGGHVNLGSKLGDYVIAYTLTKGGDR
jgi:quinoprotein glucose dehydrogenase